MKIHLAASRVHKWLALIIGAQLLIWFISGAIMSALPTDKVMGENLVELDNGAAISADRPLISPSRIVAQAGAPVKTMNWYMLDGRVVAELTTTSGVRLFDAQSGAALPPVDAKLAMRVAANAWKAVDKPRAVATLVIQKSPEYRETLPAWRVAFADPERTSVFVARDSGRITSVRTDPWRIYDFFWSLHIMDWKNHEDMHSWWLLTFAIGAIVLGFAGTALLVLRWPIRRRRRRA